MAIDFSSEAAYYYEKVIRDSEQNGLPVRSRPAVSRDEKLIAQEVRRHIDRLVMPRGAKSEERAARTAEQRTCGMCHQRFTRTEWRARRLWRSIYPRGEARIDIYRHSVCPRADKE